MTEAQIQQAIQRIYDGNVDYLDSSSEDYLLRRGLINDAVEEWSTNSGNVLWAELFTNLSAAADGDKTTTAATVYSMPTNFVRMTSRLTIGSVYYDFCRPDEVANWYDNSKTNFFWITGKPTAYKLNISEAVSAGLTIEYSYQKTATPVTGTTDVLDMSRPYFAVYFVLARLYEQDLSLSMMSNYEAKTRNILDEMLIANEIPPTLYKNPLLDADWETGGVAFGR